MEPKLDRMCKKLYEPDSKSITYQVTYPAITLVPFAGVNEQVPQAYPNTVSVALV